MKLRTFLAGAAAVAMAPLASAQSADAYFDSQNTFTVSTSNSSVQIAQDPNNPSGQYYFYNGTSYWTPTATGDGGNYNYNEESYDFGTDSGYVYAQGDSFSAANGFASQSNGENYNIIFTNTSGVEQTVTMTFDVVEDLSATGDATVDAYGGWEINGYQQIGYFTNTLVGGGTVQGSYTGFTGGYNSANNDWEGTSSFTYTLAAGQTIQVQAWASGDLTAQAPTPTPEPATISLGIFSVGAFIRRRKQLRSGA